MNTEQLIKFYEDRITHLEHMLERSMEMNKTLMDKLAGGPITFPANPPNTLTWPTINPPIVAPNHCQKCGLKMEGVMGYVCTTPQCPTGLGGAWCGTQT